MLVDTGSHVTVFQNTLLESLGVAPEAIMGLRRETSRGFGGGRPLAVARARLAFDDHEDVFALRAMLAIERESQGDLPSVLGTDFIAAFRLTVSKTENLVELRPMF